MHKCFECGRNLQKVVDHAKLQNYGSSIYNKFAPATKPIGKLLDNYGLQHCCRIQILTFITAKDLAKFI